MKKILSVVMLLLATSYMGKAQEKKVLSPKATAKGTNVVVVYSQPSMRGREVFGKLVPYGEVWRTGANEATEITFKKNGMFAGHPVKAGTYTLFTIPNKDSWDIILNSELKQWGAFGYDKVKSKNVLEGTVKPAHLGKAVEVFTIKVNSNDLVMEWENTSVSVPMKF